MTIAWIRPIIWGRRLVAPDRRSGLTPTESILIIKLDAIGDVIMASPFLRELRRIYPQGRISLLVAPRVTNLVQECPYVDRVLEVDLPSPRRWWHPLLRLDRVLSFARHTLWKDRYDIAIVPRWGEDFYEAGTFAYLSGAPCRVGFSEHSSPAKQIVNPGHDRLFTRLVNDRSVKHEVLRNLDLVSALGGTPLDHGLEVWLSDDDRKFVWEVMSPASVQFLALGPGAASAKRLWPIEKFKEVARLLVEREIRVLVVGGSGDERLGTELRRALGSGVVDLTGKTTLRQSAAVLRHCSLFCGNDAGPMHLAAAVGVPVVEISCHPLGGDDNHPNSPSRFGPWGVPHRIIRPRAMRERCARGCEEEVPHCILDVPVDSVMRAIVSLMDEVTLEGRTDGS